MNQETKILAALSSIEGIGSRTLFNCAQNLIILKTSWKEFWVGRGSIWERTGLSTKQQESIRKFKKEQSISSFWSKLKQKNISVISYKDKLYPSILKEIDDYPIVLFVKCRQKDNLKGVLNPTFPIGVVGSRRMTSYGKMVTQLISRGLAISGSTIISGFMYGVDITAQLEAVRCGSNTIGVLGYGFDHIFPRSHQGLMEEMLNQGAVFISEYAPHMSPVKGFFPARNRIIAGLSLGIVVAEAGEKSGSLITARLATEYGRDVFAVPGPITNPFSEGTKFLINQGAKLVTSAEDVLNEYPTYSASVSMKDESKVIGQIVGADDQQIVNIVSNHPQATNQLAKNLNLPISEINSRLIMMEIQGKIIQKQGIWYPKVI